MVRTESELQLDLLKREVDKKDREVNRLKSEIDSLMELGVEKDRAYEAKKLQHNQVTEKL